MKQQPSSPAEVSSSLPSRICEVVDTWAARVPDYPALAEFSGRWTYGELSNRICSTVELMQRLGVRAGDRVMLVCENSRAFVAILLAISKLDAWAVLVNARLSAPEVDQIKAHSRPCIVLYTAGSSRLAAQHAKRHGASVEDIAGLGVVGIDALDLHSMPEPLEDDIRGRVAVLIYTSGTTGLAKGVMLTNRGLLFVASTSAGIRSLSAKDRLLGVLPMSHAVGLSVVLLGALLSGATVYLTSRFDPVETVSLLEREKLTVLLGAPSMFALLLEYAQMKGIRSFRYPSLRIISSSGAPLQQSLKTAVESVFGMVLHNGYGVTECSPNISQTRIETPRSDVSVGRLLPGMEMRLVGEDGVAAAVGELWLRGPNIMRGYYNAAEETAAVIDKDGWFNTRDLVRLDNDGHLFVVGRTRELIVHFGMNVYPAEVEAVLNAHPSVLRSAVIGRTGDGVQGGEEVIAFVQLVPDASPEVDQIAEHAARHLAPYKRPSEILLVPSMPLTVTGKVRKDELAKLEPARRVMA
jgi:long-chain acyl-CoA synthetase